MVMDEEKLKIVVIRVEKKKRICTGYAVQTTSGHLEGGGGGGLVAFVHLQM